MAYEQPKTTTKLINSFVDASAMKDLSMKTIMIMPTLLLQKPSKRSKAKEHSAALQRRLKLWIEGEIAELIHEGETIQTQLNPKIHRNQ